MDATLNQGAVGCGMVFQVSLHRVRKGHGFSFAAQIPKPTGNSKPSSLTRCLVLAHRYAQALERGEVESFKCLALRLGISQARLSLVLDLVCLAPDIQEAILFHPSAPRGSGVTFRQAVAIARIFSWEEQTAAWNDLGQRPQ